jgi:hypothetical protein
MTDSIIVSVAGIKMFDDCETIFDKLDRVLGKLEKPLKELVISDENGVSAIVRQYCKARDIRCRIVKTDWENNGDLAAIKRNQELILNAKLVIVFTEPNDTYVNKFIDQAFADRVRTKVFTLTKALKSFEFKEEVANVSET